MDVLIKVTLGCNFVHLHFLPKQNFYQCDLSLLRNTLLVIQTVEVFVASGANSSLCSLEEGAHDYVLAKFLRDLCHKFAEFTDRRICRHGQTHRHQRKNSELDCESEHHKPTSSLSCFKCLSEFACVHTFHVHRSPTFFSDMLRWCALILWKMCHRKLHDGAAEWISLEGEANVPHSSSKNASASFLRLGKRNPLHWGPHAVTIFALRWIQHVSLRLWSSDKKQ